MSTFASPSGSSLEELLRPIARYWWLWALFGVLSVAAGIVALLNLGLGLVAIAVLFGCYLVVSGVFEVLDGLTVETVDPTHRVFAVLLGVVTLIAGLIFLRHPGTSLYALTLVAGVYLIVAGALHLAAAVGEAYTGVGLLLGMVDVAVGGLILATPGVSLATFALMFGIALVARGVAAILEALRLRAALSPRPIGTPAT
jgi:uncharacterized membrane protein HdeD (DUF308 family)